MLHVLLVIHLIIAVCLVGVVLLQRSEGGALGIGGNGGGVMSGRAAGNLLTKTTGILATVFFLTSLGLGLLVNQQGQAGSIMDQSPANSSAPASPEAPATPAAPAAPLSR